MSEGREIKLTLGEEGRGVLSDPFDVVSREGPEESRPEGGPHIPSVVTLFHHVHGVSFFQFQLVVVLRFIGIQRTVPAGKENTQTNYFILAGAVLEGGEVIGDA